MPSREVNAEQASKRLMGRTDLAPVRGRPMADESKSEQVLSRPALPVLANGRQANVTNSTL